ncbi:MAG: XRE family transcriptional regulator [Planctomycetota bacterium]|nr:MAG: XRE family transcriptional regulator [Planctomycetota bacterium]
MGNFGVMLRKTLEDKGLTQTTFAQSVNADQGFVSQVINGRRRPPLGHVETWATALDLKGPERDAFLLAAHLDHTPAPVVERLKTLEAQQGEPRDQKS